MIEMTNLSIGYACIQPDAHHLCITIILGILARFHPEDRWSREQVNALLQQQKNSEGGFCQCLLFPLLFSFPLFFFFSPSKGFLSRGKPAGSQSFEQHVHVPSFFIDPSFLSRLLPGRPDAANQELTACIRYWLTKLRRIDFFFMNLFTVAKKKSSLGNKSKESGGRGTLADNCCEQFH